MSTRLSFKNVGVKEFTVESINTVSQSALPIGIRTPVQLDYSGDGIFVMHKDIKEQIADNLKNLILTNWGERLGRYNFGANLRPLLFDFSHKENFDQEAMVRINTAITKWMPYITPENYISTISHDDNQSLAHIKILLEYSVPALKVNQTAIQIDLYAI